MDVEIGNFMLVCGLIALMGIIVITFVLAVICRSVVVGFCVAVALAIFVAALSGVDKIPPLWDPPSVLLVVFTIIILVSGQRKWKLFLQGLKTSLFASAPNVSDAAETAALFRYIANGTLAGGGIWMLTGFILILSEFAPDKIDASAISTSFAVSLLTLFYSFFVSVFLFYPIAHRYEQAARAADTREVK